MIHLKEISEDEYRGPDRVMKREWNTLTPNGNSMNGRWVLRDFGGTMLDFDQYRHDIAERNDLKIS